MFKFSGFSPRANNAINAAISEASLFGHCFVGSEHILWGLLEEGSCYEWNSIVSCGITDKAVAEKVIKTVGKGARTELSPADLTTFGRKILEEALGNAKLLGTPAESCHIMLSILKNPDCTAVKILSESSCDTNALFRELLSKERNAFVEPPPRPHQTKTPNLDRYSRDLTKLASENQLDPVVGREKELTRIIQILARRTKNNPCLIGEAGVGKTAVVEGVAQRIVSGAVPDALKQRRLCSLDLSSMVAGAKYRGDFEERIRSVVEEVSKSGNVILFIDEVHTLIGTGSAEGAVDAANILKPQLARGEFQLIGATTTEEYRRFIEKDAALERRFQSVLVEEPSEKTTKNILLALRDRYEAFHRVTISDKAIEAAVRLSVRYLPERRLPDKAIDLVDEACSRVALLRDRLPQVVEEEDIAAVLELYTGINSGELTADENRRLLSLEDKLHERIVGQEKAVSAVAKAIRRSRTGLRNPKRPVGTFLFTGPSGVGKTELAKALAAALFGDEKALLRFDMSEYNDRSAVNKLVGSPPGYVGYEDGGKLTEGVHRHPYSVVLFDEVEKADPGVYNLFLQMMDDGILTDAQGRKVDFTNCVLIMTSNVGADKVVSGTSLGFMTVETPSDRREKGVFGEIKKTFRPEFISRIDETVVFEKLDEKAAAEIARRYYRELENRLSISGVTLTFPEEAVEAAAKSGFDPVYGARPLQRYIREKAEDPLSELLLSETVKPGDTLVCIPAGNGFLFEKAEPALQKT